MQAEGLRAQVGYDRKPRHRFGPVGGVANVLNRDFTSEAPNTAWVTEITYIRTYEGWLFLAAVMDLYSRQIVGWATAPTMTSDLVLQALVAAAWRRKPGRGVMVYSDQGCQFTSSDRQSFLKAHRMVLSMSRRGNCHDNAVAESFFSVLKKERIRRRIYPNRATAASDVLHRDVLQPDPPARFRWRGVTGRVRTALRATRQLSVYGTLAGPFRVSASTTRDSCSVTYIANHSK